MESCAYCGEDIIDEGIYVDDLVFCSQECMDAYYDERLDFLNGDDLE